MSPDSPLTAPADGKPMRRGDRWLVGCGLACGGLFVLAFLAFAVATWWAVTPGQQEATGSIADDDTPGMVRVEGLADDEGTRLLLDRTLVRLQELERAQQRETLPESMRWMSDLQGSGSSSAGLRMFFPKDLTVALERGPSGDPTVVVAANFSALVRPIRLAFEHADDGDADLYRGSTFRVSNDGSAAGFVGGTFLYADSVDALHRAADRLLDGQPVTPATTRPARVALPDGSWDVAGRLSDEDDLLSNALDELPGDLGEVELSDPGPPADLAFGFDVESADVASGRVVLAAPSAEAAERWRRRLGRRWERLAERLAESGAELEWQERIEGERLEFELRLSGLEKATDRFLAGLEPGPVEDGDEVESEDEEPPVVERLPTENGP